jgi:APA family basic amino acid/polyamine antiporter
VYVDGLSVGDVGTVVLRRSGPYAPAFRASGFPIAPVLFALVCLAIVVNQIVSDPRNSLWGLALVAAGLPVYYVWTRNFRPSRQGTGLPGGTEVV